MFLTAIWHIPTDLKPYTPEDFLESLPVNESKILTTSKALIRLNSEDISSKMM